MQTLINTYSEALAGPAKAKAALLEAFKGLTLKEKLVIILGTDGELFDSVLRYESDYTGTSGSLYDDFYWDRRETKELSSVKDHVLDNLDDLTGDETPEELAEIILNSDDDRCDVLRDMVNKGIGKACHDW
jgi:hypothetical protein